MHPIGNMEDAGLIGRYQHDQVPAVFVAGISENGVLERTLTEIAGKGIKTFILLMASQVCNAEDTPAITRSWHNRHNNKRFYCTIITKLIFNRY